MSERKACRALGVARSTARYRPKAGAGAGEEKRLVERMHEIKRKHPRYGSPRMRAVLREEGWEVNHKRVERLMKREGLGVKMKARKRRRLGKAENGASRRRAERPNHVWTWDFTFDRTEDGRTLKWLAIVDEFTRECLRLEVGRGFTAREVIERLAGAVAERGAPGHIRSDNGPEFIAQAVRRWLEGAGVETLYIEPGAPWENPYIESFNGKLKDELIKGELFTSLLEARVLTRDHREEYDKRRPHSSLGWLTPEEFARRWKGEHGAESASGGSDEKSLSARRGKGSSGLRPSSPSPPAPVSGTWNSHKTWTIIWGKVRGIGLDWVFKPAFNGASSTRLEPFHPV